MSASAAVADENEFAAWPNSAASPSQAAAAASVGPEPAPANINAELTSGGNTRKLITPSLPQLDVPGPSSRDHKPPLAEYAQPDPPGAKQRRGPACLTPDSMARLPPPTLGRSLDTSCSLAIKTL